jgi:hypothetical protein
MDIRIIPREALGNLGLRVAHLGGNVWLSLSHV